MSMTWNELKAHVEARITDDEMATIPISWIDLGNCSTPIEPELINVIIDADRELCIDTLPKGLAEKMSRIHVKEINFDE